MEDEIEDFTLPQKFPDIFEKYELRFQKTEEEASLKKFTDNSKKKHKKQPLNFDFVSQFKTTGHKPIVYNLIRFLKPKDLLAVSRTCKTLTVLFTSDKFWNLLLERDFNAFKPIDPQESLKYLREVYKFLMMRNIGIAYHTGAFLKDSPVATVELARNMSDFALVKDDSIKQLLVSLRMDNMITNDLKVSLNKEKNEVCLWASAFMIEGKQASEEKPVSQGRFKPQIENPKMKPISKVIRSYDFPKNSYLVQRTFFLDSQYLVIQLKDLDLNSEIKSPNSFILYNLKEEVRYEISSEYSSSPIKIVFCERSLGLSRDHNISYNKEFTILYDSDEVQENSDMFNFKICNNSELLCFMRGFKKTFIVIFDLLRMKKIFETCVELKIPLYEIIYTKESSDDLQNNQLFVIDYHSNVYHISDPKLPKLEQINPGDTPEEEKEIIQKVKESSTSRFPDSKRKYHFGTYIDKEDNKSTEIEYLIVQKTSYFYFIQLSNFKVHRFDLPALDSDLKQQNSDWAIFEDKIFILTNGILEVWQFSFPTFTINKVSCSTQPSQSCEPSYQWILVDPCFTVLLSLVENNPIFIDYFSISIDSTQKIIARGSYNKANISSIFYLSNMLIRKALVDVSPVITPENLQIKFEKEKLFIKATKHSFYFDLSLCISENTTLDKRWYNINDINFNLIKPTEIVKEDSAKKTKKMSEFFRIPINDNKIRCLKKNIVPKDCKRKDVDKEKREQDRVVRGKGSKYRKNVRQNERLGKLQESV